MNSQGLAQVLRSLPLAWRGLGRTRQLLAVAGAATLVLTAIGAWLLLGQTPYTTLYTGLNEQDAAAVVAKLKELNTPYTVEANGNIKVPSAIAPDLRLELAGQGLPSGGAGLVGMEIFDKTNLGITDFAQKLNHQRALEGELTRTISRLAAVEQARIHLVVPEERLFSTQQHDATAAVVLKLRPAARLTPDQVASIKTLVANSVEGLKPANVAVVDSLGNALGAPDTPAATQDRALAARLDAQRLQESDLEQKIQGLLDRIVGPRRAVVRATVVLDWDQVEQKIETFSPGSAAPQVRSQHAVHEQVAGAGGANPATGVPGTQTNLAGAPTYQGLAADQAGSNTTYEHTDTTITNELSSDRQSIVRAVGSVKQIGLAVTIDQAAPAAQIDQLTALITAAAGLQPQRGDQLSVVSLPFDAAQAQGSGAGALPVMPRALQDWYAPGVKLLGVLLALGGLFFLFSYLSRSVRPQVLAGRPALPGGSPAALPDTLDAAYQLGDASPAWTAKDEAAVARRRVERERLDQAKQARLQAEASQRQHRRDAVAEMARDKPEMLAAILTRWLEDDREKGFRPGLPVAGKPQQGRIAPGSLVDSPHPSQVRSGPVAPTSRP